MDVNLSLAAFPGLTHEVALRTAVCRQQTDALAEPALGGLLMDHVQLVPQSFGHLTEHVAEQLQAALPDTRFRLHANVRVLRAHRFADLANMNEHRDWFVQAARISKLLNAPAYTAHSGSRRHGTLMNVLDNARRLSDLFGCPVGVEGQYPTARGDALVDNWCEYAQLLHSGVPYALDLSHLNILAIWSGQRNETLVAELLSCERCIEIHLSDNDGSGDWHQVCDGDPWWMPLLVARHADAVVFSEGNHLRRRAS